MKYLQIIFVLCMALTVVACRTTKTADASPDASSVSAEAFKNKVLENAQIARTVTGKMRFEIVAGDKNFTLNGSLKMKRDDVIQLSLTFLGMEVGRMEFTSDEVLIVDRFNKQYVRVPYNKVSFLQSADLDFSALQALFWNELFVPGGNAADALDRFTLTNDASGALLRLTDAPRLDYSFRVQTAGALIEQTTVADKTNSAAPSLTWAYDDFAELDHRRFPRQMKIAVTGTSKPYRVVINLTSLSNDANWSTRTEISSRYKEQSVDAILQKLMKL